MTANQATATAEPVGAPIGSEPPHLSGPRIITNALIDAVANGHCGWSRKQLEILGVPWPAQSGWRQRLVAEERSLSDEQVTALYDARKKPKRTAEADPAEIPVLPCPWCSRPVQRIEQGGRLKEFCSKRHNTAFNNALTKASIEYARLLRTPGALKTWTEPRFKPSPSGAAHLGPSPGAGQEDGPSAPPRDEVQ